MFKATWYTLLPRTPFSQNNVLHTTPHQTLKGIKSLPKIWIHCLHCGFILLYFTEYGQWKTTGEFLISRFPLQNKTTNQETKNPPSVLHLKHRSSLFFLTTFTLNLIKSFKIAVHLGFFSVSAVTCLTTSQGNSATLSYCTWWNVQVLTPKLLYLCRSSFASPYNPVTQVKTQGWVTALDLHYTITH